MTTVYVVTTYEPGGPEIKKFTIESWALAGYIKACQDTPLLRVVMFEFDWQGPFVSKDVHVIAYAKVMQNDFEPIQEQCALPEPVPEPPKVRIEAVRVSRLSPVERLEERVFALEAEMAELKMRVWKGINT